MEDVISQTELRIDGRIKQLNDEILEVMISWKDSKNDSELIESKQEIQKKIDTINFLRLYKEEIVGLFK